MCDEIHEGTKTRVTPHVWHSHSRRRLQNFRHANRRGARLRKPSEESISPDDGFALH